MPVTREAVRASLGSEQSILATSHSQRSQAHLSVRLVDDLDALPLMALVERVEKALGTPLQAAVKRIDEQAFALANGQNLMFCEDAARRRQAGQGFRPRRYDPRRLGGEEDRAQGLPSGDDVARGIRRLNCPARLDSANRMAARLTMVGPVGVSSQ